MKKKYSYALLVFLTLISVYWGLLKGAYDNSLQEVFSVIINRDKENLLYTIIWDIRIPRILCSFFVGCSLGLSGALIQFSTRSPFGDPHIFGVGGGASFFKAFVVAGIITFSNINLFLTSIIGGLIISSILVALLHRKDFPPIKITIIGIALGAISVALSTGVVSYGKVFPSQALGLISGSFSSSSWEILSYTMFIFLLSVVISIFFIRSFTPLLLGDTLAKTLGVSPSKSRLVCITIAGLLASTSVYAAGIVGFVGLLSPHLARNIIGNDSKKLLMSSILIGGIFVRFADQVARSLFSPTELPVGMITTAIAAPLMIYIGYRLRLK